MNSKENLRIYMRHYPQIQNVLNAHTNIENPIYEKIAILSKNQI